MNEIVMPKLSDTMTEGRLVSWKKQVGEPIHRGDVIAEVETDKANMELEAFASGVLLEIRIPAGELAQVGTVIAVVGEAEEKGAPAGKLAATTQAEPATAALTAPKEAIEEEPAEVASLPGERALLPAVEAPASVAPPVPGAGEAGGTDQEADTATTVTHGVRAAPVVRRRARELGIDLGQVKGSGPEGRILSQDLQLQETVTLIPAGTQEEARAAEGSMPLSRLRVAIARTVAESWGTIPHFSVTVDVNMEATEGVRRQLKDCGIPVTLNDIVIKGVSLALKKFPRLNASFAADAIKIHDQFNIGVAVEIPEGVLVPVIPACQRLSLQEISSASCQLVDRARRGTLSEQEMSGGTFSISNLGMYGVSQFSAIIYPSQAAVLAVGVVDDVVIVRGGVPVCSRVMKVTLSADHRIVDGGYGAKFLTELKDILEKPVRLLI